VSPFSETTLRWARNVFSVVSEDGISELR